jgi:hypothetical protein
MGRLDGVMMVQIPDLFEFDQEYETFFLFFSTDEVILSGRS